MWRVMDNEGNIFKIPLDRAELEQKLNESFITALTEEEEKTVSKKSPHERMDFLIENRAMRRERQRQERREERRILRAETRRR